MRPLHLLLFDKALSDNLIDGRFHEAGRDSLTVAVALSIVGNEIS